MGTRNSKNQLKQGALGGMWLNRRDTNMLVGLIQQNTSCKRGKGSGNNKYNKYAPHSKHRYSKVGKGRGKAEVRENLNTRTG